VSLEQPYQLIVISGEEIRTFDLPQTGEVTIGRGDGTALRIDDPSVSRRHAVLRVGDGLEIEDLGGSNGTFVRQKARPDPMGPGSETLDVSVRHLLSCKASLAVGDCVLFGTTSVMVRHVPRVELPDLLAEDAPVGGGPTSPKRRDPVIQRLYADAARAARANISVLLLGETGVGKEVLARAIHARSARAKGPFMGINCAALAESLVESELFGSEKGAFTGAVGRSGLFEAASGGTVFLDEVGELPQATQVKLLRVLEERAVTRLGSTRPRRIDVRFVAATNRDPEADTRSGRMRPDLFFRLNGVTLFIPPLRERPLDLEALTWSFLRTASLDLERVIPLAISPAALALLRSHTWPGNVRELRNVIERAVVMCSSGTILPEHLPPSLLGATQGDRGGTSLAARSPAPQGQPSDLHTEMKAIRRNRILEALERCHGNQSEAARQLGMPRRTLVSHLTELGLTRRRSPGRDV
jgi:two-component system, NtrC family, response regulator AtoC